MRQRRRQATGHRPQPNGTRRSNPQSRRTGAALLEVLMAMIVMGIGVLTVATLFPISVLRAVQATKLTNATIMRYNAEARIDMDRTLVFDPDFDGVFVEHFDEADMGFETQNYVVDPLGFHVLDSLGPTFAVERDNFGANDLDPPIVKRFAWDTADIGEAEALVGDEDGWNSISDGLVTDATDPMSAVLDPAIDVATIEFRRVPSRVILLDETAKLSHTRRIWGVSGQTVFFTEDVNNNMTLDPLEDSNGNGLIDFDPPVPAGFAVLARVETRDPRNFTWMLTVRNTSQPGANPLVDPPSFSAFVDVVVFYRRPLEPGMETIYDIGPQSAYEKLVTYTAGAAKPWKRGGFLFDTHNARWYKIQKVTPQDSTHDVLTLDRPVPALESMTNAAFPRGVVDVFPIGDKSQ